MNHQNNTAVDAAAKRRRHIVARAYVIVCVTIIVLLVLSSAPACTYVDVHVSDSILVTTGIVDVDPDTEPAGLPTSGDLSLGFVPGVGAVEP